MASCLEGGGAEQCPDCLRSGLVMQEKGERGKEGGGGAQSFRKGR